MPSKQMPLTPIEVQLSALDRSKYLAYYTAQYPTDAGQLELVRGPGCLAWSLWLGKPAAPLASS